jgi:uncharacterized protein YneF (UPF0154 family)
MDIATILTLLGTLIGGSGGVWFIWKLIKAKLPANPSRDKLVEEIFRQLNKQTAPPEGPTVPDRATALQYCEAVLRFLEKGETKAGVDAMVKVMAEIASPTKATPSV